MTRRGLFKKLLGLVAAAVAAPVAAKVSTLDYSIAAEMRRDWIVATHMKHWSRQAEKHVMEPGASVKR